MKAIYTLLLLFILPAVYAQDLLTPDAAGIKLQQFYLSMDVENNWIAGHHIDWESGKPDKPEATQGIKTHCSAFAAEACKKVGIYLLRPPEHGQVLLANAQYDWLQGKDGVKNGWYPLIADNLYAKAQQLANQGRMVVAVFKNADRSKPGHIAMIMPANRTPQQIRDEGPELIMAGTHNFNYISLKKGFKSHITTWPETEILFYVQDKVPFSAN